MCEIRHEAHIKCELSTEVHIKPMAVLLKGEPGDGMHEALQRMYPIGSLYMSVADTDPAELFGGTWERIEDTFLLAAGSAYAAGETGGEATHVLAASELPSHQHSYNMIGVSTQSSRVDTENQLLQVVTDVRLSNGSTSLTGSSGGGLAHNNLPPYLAVYVWKRIA